ncbi:YbeD family protein [Coxiella burnetii]|uniref:Uncharacterized protein n=2 Tax=Coxiella burnetii TaxID=777 RepID=Q83C67_COXBU|nr:DUF493 domain-containing protein [Coxiella burnetii]NP_820256.1 hypothetical protein CBU_1262 [Coxiella burnetii RSA 493]AAO90770.1 hypothetical protein CBU_1262 [Coxiella burnetii RSA 493]ABS78245.1 hypothetical protein CBUD_1346 [Coxiella burnetii Dugway 5J108-111]ABX77398.1 conserved hypothetical protein [Coxiella burnetii RSA 331]ACJ20318.1 hypothetical protein CbuK_1123 [Coxiella burnetii CbuK_Q154]AIT63383.1 hypothetical protein CBNA_1114 [Coxiella burnetii str. Namibia]
MMDNTNLIQFPCDFTLKVVGRANEKFEKGVLAIVRKHFPKFTDTYKKRLSRDAHFLALSITVHVESKLILDNLYQELCDSPFVIMTL